AHEVSDSVLYLLASANTKWELFPYEAHLNSIHSGMDGRAIGAAWLANEVSALERESDPLPYTYALTDLRQLNAVASATAALARTLTETLTLQPTRNAISAALAK